jgi:hypothetical protein
LKLGGLLAELERALCGAGVCVVRACAPK